MRNKPITKKELIRRGLTPRAIKWAMDQKWVQQVQGFDGLGSAELISELENRGIVEIKET